MNMDADQTPRIFLEIETSDATHRRDYLDLNFTVIATPEDSHVEYQIYAIVDDAPSWHAEGGKTGGDRTNVLADAERFMHGSVKWDGCSNWWFDDHDRNHWTHGCSREDLARIGQIMVACWDWTAALCENWEG